MLLALGAASAALDALTSLVSPKPSSPAATTGFGQTASAPFDIAASPSLASSVPGAGTPSQGGGLSPATMSALLTAQSQSSNAAAAKPSQFDALKALFSQLDADGDGQISKTEFEKALGAGGTNIAKADDVFGKMDKDGDGSIGLDEMSSALKGRQHHRSAALSRSSANGVSASAASAYNTIEQARQREAQALSASLASSLSISA